MSIRRIPIHNTMKNDTELLEGEIIDVLPDDHSVYVDQTGKTYNPAKGVRMSDLPTAGVTQFPRTTWYATPIPDDVVIVGYRFGAHGCEPMYERRSEENGTHAGPRIDALGSGPTLGGGRHGRARNTARAPESLAVADPECGSGSRAE